MAKKSKLLLIFIFVITAALAGAAIWIGWRLSKEKEVTPEESEAANQCCSSCDSIFQQCDGCQASPCFSITDCEYPQTSLCVCHDYTGGGEAGMCVCEDWDNQYAPSGSGRGCAWGTCSGPPATCEPDPCPTGWDECGTSVTCNGPCTGNGCQQFDCCNTTCPGCNNTSKICRYCRQQATTTTSTTRTTTTTTTRTTSTTSTTSSSTSTTSSTIVVSTTTTTTTTTSTTSTSTTTTSTTSTTTTTIPEMGIFDDARNKLYIAGILIFMGTVLFVFNPIENIKWLRNADKVITKRAKSNEKEAFEKRMKERISKEESE